MQSKILTAILSVLILAGAGYIAYESRKKKSLFKSGDIIFQTSLTSQNKAIQFATKSKYSHCGIIYKKDGVFYVYEAVQPVKSAPLDQWIARGENGYYVVRRLKDADKILTPEAQAKMEAEGKKFIGKDYDLTFEWSDDKIYCSELIWKVYDRALGVQIGELQKLGDFDLSFPQAQTLLEARYGGINNVPFDETVISPISIFNSGLLETVKDAYPSEQ
ncbi:MAG: YiiX family permuted papain-like enzyme [Endomicrobium sp.]|nr:YiiX family permuted papain-like enzyme [Endomicrobium sp.]